MKIDAHQHFWNFDPIRHDWINDKMEILKTDFLPPDLKCEMDKVGMEACIAVQADQSEQETEFLLMLAKKYNFIRGVVGWLDLQAPDIEMKLQHFCQFDVLKGLRHLVQDEPDDDFLLRTAFLKGISCLKNFNLCYDLLIYSDCLPVAIAFISKFPDQRFVLDHLAKPKINNREIGKWADGIRELAEHPKLYCKISGMVTEAKWNNWNEEDFRPYLDVVFDAFGPQRLIFGSDWPVCTLAASYGEVLEIIKNYIHGFSNEEQDLILGGNAEKVYGIQ